MDDGDVEEPVLVQDPGVDELVLAGLLRLGASLVDELPVREGPLRVAVEVLPIGVGGRGVDVPPQFLGVLAVVALRVRQPEEALLQAVKALLDAEADA